jgi:hypothetical protein
VEIVVQDYDGIEKELGEIGWNIISASVKAFPAVNLGTFLAGILMVAPV